MARQPMKRSGGATPPAGNRSVGRSSVGRGAVEMAPRPSVQGGTKGTPNSTRFYKEMFAAGLAAAFAGSLIFNYLIERYYVEWSNVVIMGVGMAVMAFLIVLACGMVESVMMAIADEHGGVSVFKALVFAVLAALVVGGAAMGLEFVYELGYQYVGVNYDDYVFVIDDSGSMFSSDRKDKRYEALEMLVESMDESNQVGLVRFSSGVDSEAAPALLDDAHRQTIDGVLAQTTQGGGTDIQVALMRAAEMLDTAKRQGYATAVILLSDGAAYVDTDAVAQRFNGLDVDICTVALGHGADRRLLQTLADDTGGLALEVSDADMLRSTYRLLNGGRLTRCLLLPRIGADRSDLLHAAMCVIFLAVLGVLIGGALILMFNTHYMNPHVMVCVAASGVGALILELGNDFGLGGVQRTILLVLYGLILIQCGVRGLSGRSGRLGGDRSRSEDGPVRARGQQIGGGSTGGRRPMTRGRR